jgi:hypothetical protein
VEEDLSGPATLRTWTTADLVATKGAYPRITEVADGESSAPSALGHLHL